MKTHRKILQALTLSSAMLLAATATSHAQSSTTGPEKMQGADVQKMKEECESRKGQQQEAKADKATDPEDKKETSIITSLKEMAGMEKTAKEKNQEIVQDTKTAPDGSKVAKAGDAKPEENWFGCPPDKKPADQKQ